MEPTETDVQNYIAQLTEQEKHILEIAKIHLETSFDIVRTVGFIEWFKCIWEAPSTKSRS